MTRKPIPEPLQRIVEAIARDLVRDHFKQLEAQLREENNPGPGVLGEAPAADIGRRVSSGERDILGDR